MARGRTRAGRHAGLAGDRETSAEPSGRRGHHAATHAHLSGLERERVPGPMSDATALERNDTETAAAEPGLRVPFNAHAASHADSRDAREETRAPFDSRARRTRLTKLLLA